MGHVHPEDMDLITALSRGEQAAFDRFFETYFNRLYRFCRLRLKDDHACEDIVQETLIKALRSLPGFRGDAALFTWLCQIARSEMSNWYQRNNRHIENTVEIDGDRVPPLALVDTNGDLEAQVTTVSSVERVLATLPEPYRTVLELKYLEGLSVTQIASILTTGDVAVQSLLARARKAFRESYGPLDGEVPI